MVGWKQADWSGGESSWDCNGDGVGVISRESRCLVFFNSSVKPNQDVPRMDNFSQFSLICLVSGRHLKPYSEKNNLWDVFNEKYLTLAQAYTTGVLPML